MKIENNGISPLSTNRPETANKVEKQSNLKNTSAVRSGQDKIEMSENARLLAKARVELDNVEDVNSEHLTLLKKQIESGDYSIQLGDLARKLVGRFLPK